MYCRLPDYSCSPAGETSSMTTRKTSKAAEACAQAATSSSVPSNATPDLQGKRAPAVAQAVRILRCLSAAPAPMGVSAVARELGLSSSTCFVVLRTLVAEGLLTFDPAAKVYRLGLGLVEIASPVLGLDYLDLVRPLLLGIAARFNSLVAFWQITPDERMILIERFHSDQLRALGAELREAAVLIGHSLRWCGAFR